MFLVVVWGGWRELKIRTFSSCSLILHHFKSSDKKGVLYVLQPSKETLYIKIYDSFSLHRLFQTESNGRHFKKNKKNTRFFFSNCSKTVKDRKISIKVKAAHEEYLLKMVLHIVLPLKIVCDNCFCSSRHSACSRCRPNHLV